VLVHWPDRLTLSRRQTTIAICASRRGSLVHRANRTTRVVSDRQARDADTRSIAAGIDGARRGTAPDTNIDVSRPAGR